MYYSFPIITAPIKTFQGALEHLHDLSANCIARRRKGGIRLEYYTPEFIAKVTALAFENQTFRWRMKRLIHKWRLARLRRINDTDLLTLEPPRNPLFLYDWANRSIYTFEARTILRDMRERVLMRDQLFPVAAEPRNPYTNQPLTYGQLFFLHTALKSRGLGEWWLAALADMHFEFPKFCIANDSMLRRAAHQAQFRCLNSDPDLMELLLDFVEAQHTFHGFDESFNESLYNWGFREQPQHPRMVLWRKACADYWAADFTEPSGQRVLNRRNDVTARTEELCGPMQDLVVLRGQWRRERKAAGLPFY